jgi:hypothetical protein
VSAARAREHVVVELGGVVWAQHLPAGTRGEGEVEQGLVPVALLQLRLGAPGPCLLADCAHGETFLALLLDELAPRREQTRRIDAERAHVQEAHARRLVGERLPEDAAGAVVCACGGCCNVCASITDPRSGTSAARRNIPLLTHAETPGSARRRRERSVSVGRAAAA